MNPTDLHNRFAKEGKYGSIEFVYKGGKIVFAKATETFVSSPADENNSDGVPRRDTWHSQPSRPKS